MCYGNAEERRVITGSETETAKALGQGTRTNHYAGYGGYLGFKSKGPLSVKPETMKHNITNRNKPQKSFLERLFNW